MASDADRVSASPSRLHELGFYTLAGAPESPRELIDEVRRGEELGLGSVFISERWNIKEAAALGRRRRRLRAAPHRDRGDESHHAPPDHHCVVRDHHASSPDHTTLRRTGRGRAGELRGQAPVGQQPEETAALVLPDG
jgi:hypothetical protein